MTEITENAWMPSPTGPRYNVDPVAFFIALIGGPLLVTVGTVWMLFIPVAALVLGGPLYLLIGTPLLLIYLRRHPCTLDGVAALAAVSVLMILPVSIVASFALGDPGLRSVGSILTGFGLIFGPIWGLAFAGIYRALCRDMFATPHPL